MSLVEMQNTINNNEVSSEDRKKTLGNILEEREVQRQAEIASRNEKRRQEKAAHENQDLFSVSFTAESDKIKEDLDRLKASSGNVDPTVVLNDLQNINVEIDLIQKHFNESTSFLPVRSVSHYTNQIKLLQDTAAQIKESLAPTKKFAFRVRKKAKDAVPKLVEPHSSVFDAKDTSQQNAFSVKPLFDSLKECTLSINRDKIDAQDVVLQNISKSHIKILGCPATLHLLNVDSSEILIGPCSTSVFLEKCSNSTIALACQQLRCHSTNSCELYVHITSRGIIEDCENIKIAPYSLTYSDLEKDFCSANLPRDRNNWNKIDDFNWLSKSEKSPNFIFIPESERKSFQV